MSDFGDFVSISNSYDLGQLQQSTRIASQRYDLDKQVEYIKERYNASPEGWTMFNKENPARQARSLWSRMNAGVIPGALLGAAAGGIIALASGGLGVIAVGIGFFGGAFLGAVVNALSDESPAIMQEQIGKYDRYLKTLEGDLSAGRVPSVPFHPIAPVAAPAPIVQAQAEATTKHRDALASRQTDQLQTSATR